MTDDNRKRLGPPPVEPLSDIAWSRIERGMWSRLDGSQTQTVTTIQAAPPSRRWMLVAAPLAAAAAIALVIGFRGRIAPAEDPARVLSGDTGSSVSFGDAHIELDAHSAIAMRQESGSPTVTIDNGAARFTVAPRNDRPAFVVRAGDATVRVIGTQFKVARYEEHLSVAVEHGLVDVHFRGVAVKIGAGQSWSSDQPTAVITMAEPAKPAQPAADEPEADTSEIEMPATPSKPHVKHHPKQPSHHVATEPAKAPAEVPSGSACGTDCTEFNRLSTIEPSQPDKAIDGYLALSRSSQTYADNALFAAARLAFDRHDRRAEALLKIYLQRFPSGAHSADANGLLVRLKGDHP